MSTIFYAVYNDSSYESYDELEFAIKSKPEYIFSLRSKGFTKSVFPERTIEDEHFDIKYLNAKGEMDSIEKNGWKAYDIVDPDMYGSVLHLKIRDPKGIVRVFSRDEKRVFFNTLKYLIKLVNTIKTLNQYKSWKSFERKNGDIYQLAVPY